MKLEQGVEKLRLKAMLQRCAAFVNAHLSLNRLRIPKRRTPWLTA